MRDYLADLITRIKNGQRAGLLEVAMHPYLPTRYLKILRLLYREGYIRGYVEHWDNTKGKLSIKVLLKYNGRGEPIIENIFQVSKPGRLIRASIKALWQPKGSRGVLILSTTKGYITDRDARFLNLGGEVLFGVY